MNSMAFNHVNFLIRRHLTNDMSNGIVQVPFIRKRTISSPTSGSYIIAQSKAYKIQDFQDFAKPSRLLPATKADIYGRSLPKDLLSTLELDAMSSFYIVELSTSQDFDSSLGDINAAILLCLIDNNGDSILQRIPLFPLVQPINAEGMGSSEFMHFQRGSVDIVTFAGSRLEKIDALWIGLESGSWRLDGLRLTVINGEFKMASSLENTDNNGFNCSQYEFEVHNILLGEKGMSISELRPLLLKDLPKEDFYIFLNNESLPSSSLDSNLAEAGMKEYADLKFSLLVYDLFLISSGSSILMLFFSDREAFSFLVGGIVGFIYLLQLQRSVDGLPAPTSEYGEKFVESSREFRRQWLISAVLVTTIAAVLKNRMEGEIEIIRPLELFIGIGGFFTSKMAVVLAALRPIRRNMKKQ